MPYRQTGSFDSMFSDEPVEAAARRTTRRVGELLKDRVAEHTPVAEAPPGADAGDWLRGRERTPGELKRSWKVGVMDLSIEGATYSIDVYTEDEVAPHVEYNTAPHEIRPRRPDGFLRFHGRDGSIVYAKLVHHPGTRGAYMMATALAEVAAEWERIGEEELFGEYRLEGFRVAA